MTDLAEDEGEIELSSIQAIFPELEIDPEKPRSAYMELEVTPAGPLTLNFFSIEGLQRGDPPKQVSLRYLPSLCLEIDLPKGYPEEEPPEFLLYTGRSWLPRALLGPLEEEGKKTWERCGRSQCIFAYIDYLQSVIESGFGMAKQGLGTPDFLEEELVAYDKQVKKEKFEEKTYDCGVCLSPKSGKACYQMRRCDHVFCKGCLQDFYNNAINEGDVGAVKCMEPDCARGPPEKRKKPSVHPTELLDIPIARDKVQRYVDLKLKKLLESDKTTIYCPRKWCQAPARAAKYARYNTQDLDSWPDSDDDDVAEVQNAALNQAGDNGRLAICSKCAHAFCRVCSKGWHGDFINCLPERADETLSEEEKASYDYIRTNTSPCPYCNSPSQKMMGCNHMVCFQCKTHFCYLCSSWLSPMDPYKHFNTLGTACYERLWELEEGDDGQGRAGIFAGPRAAEQEAILGAQQVAAEAEHREAIARAEPGGDNLGVDEDDDDDDDDDEDDDDDNDEDGVVMEDEEHRFRIAAYEAVIDHWH